MKEQDVNNLIEKRILETKLQIIEKRFNYLLIITGALLTIFGVLIPLFVTNNSSQKIDKELENVRTELRLISGKNQEQLEKYSEVLNNSFEKFTENQTEYFSSTTKKIEQRAKNFEKRFNELADAQIKKPVLVCLYNGDEISNTTIYFTDKQKEAKINIKNIGDAIAKNITIGIYTNIRKEYFDSWHIFDFYFFNNQPNYKYAYKFKHRENELHLDPQNGLYIPFTILPHYNGATIPIILKVFYGQPEPKVYKFTLSHKTD